ATTAARLGHDPRRATPAGRDLGAALAGVSPEPAERLSVQLVLRALPSLAGQAGRGDAPGTSRWREVVRRLRRADGAGDRPPQRRDPPGAGVRRGAWCIQLHLRRSHLVAAVT